MIFACRIKDGQVNFSNQYVQTNRLKQERKAGHPLGLKVSSALKRPGIPVSTRAQVHFACHGMQSMLVCIEDIYCRVIISLSIGAYNTDSTCAV